MDAELLAQYPLESSEFSTLILLQDRKGEDFLEEMANSINDWDDAWREMLYCILAGTQVSTDIVKRSYFSLIDSIPEVSDFKVIKKSPMQLQEKIASTLKLSGYRFYKTKSKTIINAANYFADLIKDYENFRYMDWYDARTRLIKNVNGIGNKIASHWLRNIGFQLPIIDIHVRRVLSCAGLIDTKYAKYQISDSEYWYLEKKVIEISNQINIDVAKLDFILWSHGREYCVHKACIKCPFGKNDA
jgi:thermostable 8-oxoguanine DNA glycosylase